MMGIKTFFRTGILFSYPILTFFSSTGCKEDSVPVTTQHQTGRTQLQLAIGGTGSDLAYSIIRTLGGGYAVAGATASFGAGDYDFYIMKLDGSGNLQWSRTIGGITADGINSIIQTTDGGYAVAGYTTTFGAGNYDFYIVKLDGSGNLQWDKTLGGTSNDFAHSIIQTTDGGYAVAGTTFSFGVGLDDMYIVKLDGSGNLLWNKTVGGTNWDEGFCIINTTDGGYAVAGSTASFGAGNNDFYIVKLDGSGNLQWNRTVGSVGDEIANSIIQATDGDYVMAGYTTIFGAGGEDFYIVKLNTSDIQWSKTVGGTGNDFANSIIQTTDGGYAVAGNTQSFGAGDQDFYIFKLNATGSLQWNRTVGGANQDVANSIVQTTDGGYAVAGYTFSFGAGDVDLYIVKLDNGGNTCQNTSTPTVIPSTGGTLGNPTPTVTSPIPTVTSPTPGTSTGGTIMTLCVVNVPPISNETPGSENKGDSYGH